MRLIWYALQAGLSEAEAWKTTPGRIVDMFIWRREYDERLHGLKTVEGSADDGS